MISARDVARVAAVAAVLMVAWVLLLTGTALGEPGDLLQTFVNPGAASFGYAAASVGDKVVVGAPHSNAAFIFDASTGKLDGRNVYIIKAELLLPFNNMLYVGSATNSNVTYFISKDLLLPLRVEYKSQRTSEKGSIFNSTTTKIFKNFNSKFNIELPEEALTATG